MPRPNSHHALLPTLVVTAALLAPLASPCRAQGVEPSSPLTVSAATQTVETPYLKLQWDLARPDMITGLVYKSRDPYRNLGPYENTLHEFFGQDARGVGGLGAIDSQHLEQIDWHVEAQGWNVAQIFTRTVSTGRPPVETRYTIYADRPWFVVERTIRFSQVPFTGRYSDWISRVAFYDTYRALRYRDTNGVLQQRGWCALPCTNEGWNGRWLQQVGYTLGRGQSVATIYPSSVPAGQPIARALGPNSYSGWVAPVWDSLTYTTDVTRRVMVAFSTQPDSVRQLDSLWTVFNSPNFTLDAPPPARVSTLRLAAAPNPSRGAVTLTCALPRAQHARLEVLDLSGRRVATLYDGDAPAGEMRVAWNGRAEGPGAAREASPGMYWARLVTADGVRTRTIVRVR